MIKKIIRAIGVPKARKVLKSRLEAISLKGKSSEEIFTDIYRANVWEGKESVSGRGSDSEETYELLKVLPGFFQKYQIRTIIDLPCGDFNWMKHLNYNFNHYVGIDIVKEIIIKNREKYGSKNRVFEIKNCLIDSIGNADLIFCRDMLIHFSNEEIFIFFENLKYSDSKYLLTTNFLNIKNKNVVTGQWRPINLTEHPFKLPEPIDYFFENTKMFGGKYSKKKTMSLWRISDIFSNIGIK